MREKYTLKKYIKKSTFNQIQILRQINSVVFKVWYESTGPNCFCSNAVIGAFFFLMGLTFALLVQRQRLVEVLAL